MGWLIALGILVFLAVLPLGVSAAYDGEGPLVRLLIGPVRLRLFPAKKKKEKPPKKSPEPPPEQEASKDPPAGKGEPTAEKPKRSGGDLKQFLPLVQVALDFLGDFRRKLRVNRLEMKLILAGDDPCDLATNYGRAWAALGNLWPRLEELFVIKKRDVQVECDFTSDKTLISARLDLTITLGRLIALAVRYGIRALRELLKLKNPSKGGKLS